MTPITTPTKQPKLTWEIADIYSQDALQKACWNKVVKHTGDPLLIDFLTKLIRKWNIPERNDEALARAIQVFAQKYIKFFREKPERFASPIRSIIWGIGDCDDKSIFIATSLRSFRIPVKLGFLEYFVNDEKGNEIKKSHVLPYVKLNNEWKALESVHAWPLGKDPKIEFDNKKIRNKLIFIGDT